MIQSITTFRNVAKIFFFRYPYAKLMLIYSQYSSDVYSVFCNKNFDKMSICCFNTCLVSKNIIALVLSIKNKKTEKYWKQVILTKHDNTINTVKRHFTAGRKPRRVVDNEQRSLLHNLLFKES